MKKIEMRYMGLGLGEDRSGEERREGGSFTLRVKPAQTLQAILM